jgi:hypothetical protein
MINQVQICKLCKKNSEKHPNLKWAEKDICLECHNKPKPKFYFDVKVEAMLPAVLTYKVLAEDAKQASEMIKHMHPISVKHKLIGRKELKLMVYDAGSCVIRFAKDLLRR